MLKVEKVSKNFMIGLKISGRIHAMVVEKIKQKYPHLDVVSFSKKLYEHIDAERGYYDDLFNQLFSKELELRK